MNQEFIKEQLHKWMTDFVEVPNIELGDWPPCPYARQARVNNKISIKFSSIPELNDIIRESIETLTNKEVVIICFDHTLIDPVLLQEFVESTNNFLMPLNYVVLEDHPHTPEYINGVKMNFGHCGLLILQKLDKLTIASNQLKEKGYYDVWSKNDLDSVVSWRTK